MVGKPPQTARTTKSESHRLTRLYNGLDLTRSEVQSIISMIEKLHAGTNAIYRPNAIGFSVIGSVVSLNATIGI
jgi:hypothetical protein